MESALCQKGINASPEKSDLSTAMSYKRRLIQECASGYQSQRKKLEYDQDGVCDARKTEAADSNNCGANVKLDPPTDV